LIDFVLQLGGMGLKSALAASGDPDDEPPHKKQKTEESLIPEAQFLAQNKVSLFFNKVLRESLLPLYLMS
jgi:hypothetical protein